MILKQLHPIDELGQALQIDREPGHTGAWVTLVRTASSTTA